MAAGAHFTQEQILRTRQELQKMHFPALESFNDVEMGDITHLFRWFSLYRSLIRDPFPVPSGTLCELVLVLDLLRPAFLDYSIRADVSDKMHAIIKPLEEVVLMGHVNKLKRKAYKLYYDAAVKPSITTEEGEAATEALMGDSSKRAWPSAQAHFNLTRQRMRGLNVVLPPHMTPTLGADLNAIYRWFWLYRVLARDGFPHPRCTRCELVLMMDLVSAALVHCEMCGHTRVTMLSYMDDFPKRTAVRALRYLALRRPAASTASFS